jgi:hypothetical protein
VKRRIPLVAVVCASAAIAAPVFAASGGNGNGPGNNHAHGPAHWVAPPRDNWAGHGTDPANPQACDPFDPAQCMLPYPNDWFTKPDASSATGRRLDLNVLAMPRNEAGKPIEPQEWNRSDGFSAGAQILTVVPGMTKNADLVPSGLPPVTDLAMNEDDNLGVVLLDEETGRRWPVWVEVDQYTDEAGAEPAGVVGSVQQDLMIHPAENLTDGHRYIVALRHLVTDNGTVAAPPAAFKAYRDGTAPAPDPRRTHMDNLFATLAKAGVGRSDLYLAWDFTTASTKNVTGRLLAIRDDAFAQLGDHNLADGVVQGSAPAFTVDSVEANPARNIARRISGHFTVPCYLAPTCEPPAKCDQISQGVFNDCPTPGQFALDPTNPDAVPSQTPGQTYQANFICNVGKTAYDAHTPMRPVEYGHGLFGGAGEVNSGPQVTMADQHGMLYCATDWTGMATADVPNALIALNDLSRFPFLTDRVQQGELNFLYLARLMVHPKGFSANPAFQWDDTHKSFIDTSEAFYDGNSQGGIFGGTVCAVSVDVRHCALGVPGMDYSILLPRSSDYVAQQNVEGTDFSKFDPTDPGSVTDLVGYSEAFDNAYPDQSQRMLVLDLIQTLWDRSDPDGYATHMTGAAPASRLPGTPSHQVLLQVAFGDHQVANITAEDEARTIGARGAFPPLVSARYGPYKDVFWGIDPLSADDPWHGSGITLFDSGPASYVRNVPLQDGGPGQHQGTDAPPTSDVPNRSGEDPHEAPRRAYCGQLQKAAFLAVGGTVTLPPCGPFQGPPYFSWGWDGTSGL